MQQLPVHRQSQHTLGVTVLAVSVAVGKYVLPLRQNPV
jgi:hypothetical protein